MNVTTTQRTPLHVIGGSLGSGKTTLLRHMLSGELGRIAVMINEFGEVGIDGSIIPGEDIEFMELAGGCVCCSLAGEFEAGVRELIDTVAPHTILVETTGVAEADSLVEDIEDDLPEVRLESVVILVDADAATRFPEFGFVESNQLATADLVVINKTDLVCNESLRGLRDKIAHINREAPQIETQHAHVDPDLILARGQRVHKPRIRDSARQTNHGMQSFSWRPPAELNRACFEQAVADWPDTVYRAKGHVRLDGQTHLFNYVAGRWQLDPEREAQAALVWIGPDVERHRSAIITALEECLA